MKKKIISIILTVSMILATLVPMVFAIEPPKPQPPADNQFSTLGSQILGYVQWFGYAIAVGMLIYIGIKYTMASADQKADLKAALIKYVIGAILIAAASTVAGWLFNIGENLS